MTEVCDVWVLCTAALRDALRRAAAGEDVETLLLSLYANSDDVREGAPDAAD